MSACGLGHQGSQRDGPSEASLSSRRVLCETVKDFVARVGKAYEKTTESSEESEVMAKKVGASPWGAGVSGRGGTPPLLPPFPPSAPSSRRSWTPC